MSWNTSAVGTAIEVRTALRANEAVPQSVQDAVNNLLDGFDPTKDVDLTTHGHIDPVHQVGVAMITVRVQ